MSHSSTALPTVGEDDENTPLDESLELCAGLYD